MNPVNQLNKPTVISRIVVLIICLGPLQNAHAQACSSRCSGSNTAIGNSALSLNGGILNTATGDAALLDNDCGNFNTAMGAEALYHNTCGTGNTATGEFALFGNTTGNSNTASGVEALLYNTTGSNNTANGWEALFNNSTGSNNTATGFEALHDNTTGNYNMASGFMALRHNTTGGGNTASGFGALASNTIGYTNTANGAGALAKNTTGVDNTADGVGALYFNTTGINNTANGVGALEGNTTGINNTASGFGALVNNTTGGGNVALGFQAGQNQTTGSGNVYIGTGVRGLPGENSACYIASIFGLTSASGIPVLINADNKLGTQTSSKRYKEDIKPMNKSSEAVFALRPVAFRYKKEIDPAGTSQFGLVAEDVEKVNPDLVMRDKEGKPYTVRYDAVNAMLLNEFLKEHKMVQEQGATITELKTQIQALTAGLQKVTAQLEVSKPSAQTVQNSR